MAVTTIGIGLMKCVFQVPPFDIRQQPVDAAPAQRFRSYRCNCRHSPSSTRTGMQLREHAGR